jgi:hypothetical protein
VRSERRGSGCPAPLDWKDGGEDGGNDLCCCGGDCIKSTKCC